jgi:hypothetical protein
MRSPLQRGAVAGGIVLFLSTGQAIAQVEINSRAVEITLTGRVHAQFSSTSVAGEAASEFFIRRARLGVVIEISDLVSGKVEPDFGEGKITLKDAYFRLTFNPAFRATIGQFKRPFDLFELTSSTQMLVVERAGGIGGLDTCSGPGGICSLSRFTEKLSYSDRDIGVMLDGKVARGRVQYMAAVFNGAGANKADENGARSFGGRLAVSPLDDLSIAGNFGVHDYVDVGAGTQYAVAFGGDVEYGNYDQGLHVQAGVVGGDNWLNLVAGEPTTFLTAQGIVAYRVPIVGNRRVSAIEPIGRVSWGDPDNGVSDDTGLLFTPGFVVHFSGRNKIGANIDIWSPAVGDTEWSLKVQSYLHF